MARRILTAREQHEMLSPWKTASERWFHTSPHDLPDGTVLTPGGGESSYPQGGGHDRVWVSPHLGWWNQVKDRGWHLYEVSPHQPPLDEGGAGWSTPAATVMTRHAQQMLSPWHSAATYWHITDNPDFRPDPNHRPELNTTMGGEMKPGLFLTSQPDHWMQGYGYWRPYVSEIEAPDDIGQGSHLSPERYVPADQYGRLHVKRTIPIDAYAREQYNEPGWVEGDSGQDFQSGSELTQGGWGTRKRNWDGKYQYPGTAMDQPEGWRKAWEEKVHQYQKRTPGIIASTAASVYPTHLSLHPDEVLLYQNPDNPWRNKDQVSQLSENIARHGVQEPVHMLTDGSHVVLDDGHHRALAVKLLGDDQVPVNMDYEPYLLSDFPHARVIQPGPLKDWLDSHRYDGTPEATGHPVWSDRNARVAAVLASADTELSDLDHILDLLGRPGRADYSRPSPAEENPPIPGVPKGWERYVTHLQGQPPSEAHLHLPVEVLDHYKEYDRDPTSEQAQALAYMIKTEGVRNPVHISTDGTHALMHEGNNRLAVAKALGITHLPVNVTLEKPGGVVRNEGTPVPLEKTLGSWVAANKHRLTSFWDGG